MDGERRAPACAFRPERPPTLPGFENISHYWDNTHELYAARIQPGQYYVSSVNEMMSTVLGSCISACIRDREAGVGGMNHFLLPPETGRGTGSGACPSTAFRYGNHAMEHLIDTILTHGGKRDRLEIKLFGGGRMLHAMTDIGSRNIHFVRDFLRKNQLSVSAEDLGGLHPRKLLYFPASGRVLLRRLPLSCESKVCERELEYQHSIEENTLDIELAASTGMMP